MLNTRHRASFNPTAIQTAFLGSNIKVAAFGLHLKVESFKAFGSTVLFRVERLRVERFRVERFRVEWFRVEWFRVEFFRVVDLDRVVRLSGGRGQYILHMLQLLAFLWRTLANDPFTDNY